MSKVKIGIMAEELAKALNEYNQDVSDAVKAAVEEQAKETLQEIKEAAPRKTGAYAKGWRKKQSYEASHEKRITLHNAKKWQLTHLLEKGHTRKTTDRGGKTHTLGRTAARVHIAPAEQRAIGSLEKKIRKAAQGQ